MLNTDKLKLLSLSQLHGLLVFLGLPASTAAPEAAVLFRELKRLKSELGNQSLAERLGLNPAEMDEFSKAMRELERALGTADMEERNRQLAILRFLSWLEALHGQNPGLAFTADLEALVSEELGRKQVRALELILRSLVGERYGDQQALEQGLTELLSGPLVAKWKQAADAGDLLSGTTFSELASLFVNTQEYPNYQPLFEGAPFLSYLKDKRKTIQNFLEDMRRIRNLLAHNKRISNTQLSLLDLYYEELISHVQQAHDQGQTRVNPDSYLEVSKEELEGYFNTLQQDIIGVKDDIAAFRAAIEANLGDIKTDTADIRAATGSIGKRQKQIAIGLVVVLLGIGLLLYLVFGTQQDTSEIKQQGAQTARVAEETKAAVEATREDVQKGSQAMQQAAESVATSSAAMRASVEDIREGFSSLSKLGGIIDTPERPEQFYHNARIFELRGDFLNARKSYERFLGFGLDVIDPYLRYLDILKAQDGAAGAAASYRGVIPAEPGAAFRAAESLLESGAERITALHAVIEQHATYAPAYYLLSQQYSQKQLGQQSMSNKRDEKQQLETFLRLASAGSFQQYFIDKEMAGNWLEDAETRLKALASIDAQTSEPPFVYTAMRSSNGWTLHVNLREVARKFYYKLEGQAEFIDTGQGNYIDQRLNAPAANTFFDLPPTQGEATLLVQYEDINGKLIGPFALEFSPLTELIKDQKRTLEMTRNSWLSFLGDPDHPLLYFTHLLSYRCAIAEVRYGLDRETPDTVWPGIGKDCNLDDPSSIDGDAAISIEVPATSRFASVQLEYRDGTRSTVVKIDRLE